MRSTLRRIVVASLASFAPFVTASARAGEPPPPRAEHVLSPGRSAVADDSAEALVLNPANLGYLPGAELRWTGVSCPRSQHVGCGHAFDLASPLGLGFATGLRLDWVSPPSTVGFPFDYDYWWLTWGLAWRPSSMLALGLSLQRSYSPNSYTDGLFGITGAISFRPSPYFAFSGIARDFNSPSGALLPPKNYPVLDRSYVAGFAFRPQGTRAIEIGGELRWLQGSDEVLPKALLGIDIPHVGRLRGDVELAHLASTERRTFLATAGLEVFWGPLSAGGGVLGGTALGDDAPLGVYGTASVASYTTPGLPRPGYAVTMRIEQTPGTRSHVALLRRLWRVADDRNVKAVSLVLRAEPASSFAHAEEIADALRLLRARGKKVLCSWEDAGARSLYVCANADRILVNPAGGLRYAGLRSQFIYLAGLLQKLGVRAQFVRVGPHKSAPEQFTNTAAGDVARADHEEMLRETEAEFVGTVAAGRKLTFDEVRAATLKGPFVASEARDARFVDGYAFDDEIERATQELVGYPIRVVKYEDETRAPRTFGPRDKVAVLYIDGDIVDGRSQNIPIVDMKMVGSYSIAETVKALRDDGSIRSVVLRIESPGGSSMASDVMWRELMLLAKKKPLIVSMGSVAASGGYYVASPARTIYALPLTLTGSIGVFFGKADVSGLLDKIGVNVETYRTTPRADADSFFRPFTDDEIRELQRKIGQFYGTFLDRVAEGRHMTKEEVNAVGEGRVWTGREAVQRHLVDKLGGLREALAEAREAGGLPADAPIVEVPRIQKSLVETALDLAGVDVRAGVPSVASLPAPMRDVARAVAPMAVYKGDVPMARLLWTPVDDVGVDEP